MVVNTIQELINLLNQVDVDATVLAAIANDSATATINGPGPGLVTTRLGTNVKNVQKVIADIENNIISGIRPNVQDEGATIVDSPDGLNFVGSLVTVTDVAGVATITIADPSVTRVGTTVDNQVAVWTGNGPLEGNSTLTFDGSVLTVNAPSAPSLNITDSNDATTLLATIINPGTPVAIFGTTTAHALRFQTSNTPRMSITPAGLIGIGTNNPSQLLTLNAETPTIRFQDASSLNFSEISNSDTILRFAVDTANTEASSAMVFEVDNTEVARFTSNSRFEVDGMIDIDYNLPNYAFNINNNNATGYGMYTYVNHSNPSYDMLTMQNSTEVVFRVLGDGNVYINNSLQVDAYVQTPYRINPQIGASYALTLADSNSIVTVANAGANSVIIDPVATTAYPVGYVTEVIQLGAGATTIDAGPGVTLNGVVAGNGTITAQYDVVRLRHVASNVWIVSGDIGAIA